MTPEEEVRRGNRAKNLLADEIYVEAYSAVRERIVSQLSLAETVDDKRERLNSLLVALATVQRYMEQVMLTGKMAAEQIERDRKFSERVLDRIKAI